jgi:thiopeptide-type bacteriocin biosynthesis protein
MASTTAPTATARPTRCHRAPQGPGHLPGRSEWLYAQLFGHPGRQSDLLTLYLPDLLADWVNGPVDDWWFIRYHEPEPHLRLRLRLHAQARYGPATRALGRWATALHKRGVLRDFTLNTYRPETGRFGSGAALRAAETVFAADSALVVAQLRTGLNAQALVAASYVDLAAGFLGAAGRTWLVEHVDHGGGPALDRTVLDQAQQPVDVPVDLVERRRRALGAYWSQLDDRNVNGTLADLLHLHHTRMIGIDPGSERVCLRLARALSQRLDQHEERGRSSTSTSEHSAPPIT